MHPYLERTEQTFVHAHHGTGIVELPTVVRRTEKRHELSFREEFVSVLDNLMRSAYEVHVVLLQES